MGSPIGCILALGMLLPSVAACTAPPQFLPFGLQAADPFVRAFGEPARAGVVPGHHDPDRRVLAGPGRQVQAIWAGVADVTVAAEARRASGSDQGALGVALTYWRDDGLQQPGLSDPVRVTYELWSGDGREGSPTLGAQLASGEAYLDGPHEPFRIAYPLPEQTSPAVYGVLKGTVWLPDGRALPYRMSVLRRSPWAP